MAALTSYLGPFVPTVRTLCASHDTTSVRYAIWRWRLARVRSLFDGSTSAEEEDRALDVILGTGSGDGIRWLVTKLGWDALDDDLVEEDLTRIAGRIAKLTDRDDYPVDRYLWLLAGNPATLPDEESGVVTARINTRVGWLAPVGVERLATTLLDDDERSRLLDAVSRWALRGLPTGSGFLREVLERLADVSTDHAAALRGLAWDVRYENQVAGNLETGNLAGVVRLLPDLVDPAVPDRQRSALLDVLVRREPELLAARDWVMVTGTPGARADAARFFEIRQAFLDNFPETAPAPGVIGTLASFFGEVTQQIDELRAIVDNAAAGIQDITLDHLLGEDDDDHARQLANELASQGRLAVLPFRAKSALVHAMLDGATDDDEQAILTVFRATKERLPAEGAQLLRAATWEALDTSFDGEEYDDLEQVFSSW